MPSLLLPSPVLLDQSFPRSEDELRLVAVALGELLTCVNRNDAHLILSSTLREFVESIDWEPPRPYALLNDIYRTLQLLYLQPQERLIHITVTDVDTYTPHPIPVGCENQGLVEFWSDELGKILTLHDQCCGDEDFFVGVACEHGFAGEAVGKYVNPNDLRAFPLVGPDGIEALSDAYDWHFKRTNLQNLRTMNVNFDDAKRNCKLLGALRVDKPSGAGGSHYMVKFEGSRSWPLDPNVDPIPDRFLRELIEITGYPFVVIKYALIFGEMPDSILKLSRVTECTYSSN